MYRARSGGLKRLNASHYQNGSHYRLERHSHALRQSAKLISAKTKYANETPPHAVSDWVSAGVSTYYRFMNQKTRLASGSQNYLTSKATIVALFALSREFSSNFLKPSLASTSRTNADLVGSTFLAFSIIFS